MKVLIPSLIAFILALCLVINPPHTGIAQYRPIAQNIPAAQQVPAPSKADSLLKIVQRKNEEVLEKNERLTQKLRIIEANNRALAARKAQKVRVVQKVYVSRQHPHGVTLPAGEEAAMDSLAELRTYDYDCPDSTEHKPRRTFRQWITNIFHHK